MSNFLRPLSLIVIGFLGGYLASYFAGTSYMNDRFVKYKIDGPQCLPTFGKSVKELQYGPIQMHATEDFNEVTLGKISDETKKPQWYVLEKINKENGNKNINFVICNKNKSVELFVNFDNESKYDSVMYNNGRMTYIDKKADGIWNVFSGFDKNDEVFVYLSDDGINWKRR